MPATHINMHAQPLAATRAAASTQLYLAQAAARAAIGKGLSERGWRRGWAREGRDGREGKPDRFIVAVRCMAFSPLSCF